MNENTQNNTPEVTEVQLDYEALWKEAKYTDYCDFWSEGSTCVYHCKGYYSFDSLPV